MRTHERADAHNVLLLALLALLLVLLVEVPLVVAAVPGWDTAGHGVEQRRASEKSETWWEDGDPGALRASASDGTRCPARKLAMGRGALRAEPYFSALSESSSSR